jgi:hypothetical protein
MVAIAAGTESVIFEVLGLHKLLALKSRIVVPIAQIRDVRADPAVKLGWRVGWRIPGTHIPGVIVAGTYYKRGKRTFWDVAHTERAIVVDLTHHRYDRLIVEVSDPAAAVDELRQVVSPRE